MTFWSKTIVELIFLQYLLGTAAGIIVEKNYYYYYKLPTEITADNTTENFFLLQCPYRATLEIPLLKEMSMCRIIARYGETKPQIPKHTEASFPTNFRHTFVTYRVNQPNINTMSTTAPYFYVPHKVYIKPIALTKVQPTVFVPTADQRGIASVFPMKSVLSTVRKPRENNENIEMENAPTSLQFLGVSSTVEKLFKDQTLHKTPTDDDDDDVDDVNGHREKQSFFTKNSKFKKGEKSKGFQNMYYRDEIFNDHIFYDDVDQHGNYGMQGVENK